MQAILVFTLFLTSAYKFVVEPWAALTRIETIILLIVHALLLAASMLPCRGRRFLSFKRCNKVRIATNYIRFHGYMILYEWVHHTEKITVNFVDVINIKNQITPVIGINGVATPLIPITGSRKSNTETLRGGNTVGIVLEITGNNITAMCLVLSELLIAVHW